MFGKGKTKDNWNWAVCGKHPVTRDYFQQGITTAVLGAFESWFEQGYQILGKREISTRSIYSWRFWSRGIKKGSLICGVGKDSSDNIGRRYPLFIMGEGSLNGWEEDWDLLHKAFEKTWDQIEYLSSKNFYDLKELKNDVSKIKKPDQNWLELKSRQTIRNETQTIRHSLATSMKDYEIKEKADYLSKKMMVIVPLDNSHVQVEPFTLAGVWIYCFKAFNIDVPNAVFIGGDPEKSYLVIFNRSLNADDFVWLWSVGLQ